MGDCFNEIFAQCDIYPEMLGVGVQGIHAKHILFYEWQKHENVLDKGMVATPALTLKALPFPPAERKKVAVALDGVGLLKVGA